MTNDNDNDNEVTLNPVTQKVIQSSIDEVLGEYVSKSKMFNADTLNELRVNVTQLANQRLGSEDIQAIDIGIDLGEFEDIPFFFRVNIDNEKSDDHVIKE